MNIQNEIVGTIPSSALDLIDKEITRLNNRIQELLECNNAYLQRARDAEAKLKSVEDLIIKLADALPLAETEDAVVTDAKRRIDTTMERVRRRFGVV